MNIILCGFPSSGKTTCGKLLADMLKKEFVDTDRLIEESYKNDFGIRLSCREVFIAEGEGLFRQRESNVINALAEKSDVVVAIGGGALMQSRNHQTLKNLGLMIYLKVAPELLLKRILSKPLPAYLDRNNPKDSFQKLFEERKKIYEEVADIQYEISENSPEEICKQLLKIIRGKNDGQ